MIVAIMIAVDMTAAGSSGEFGLGVAVETPAGG
jgi:hypothetical protein